MLQILLAEDHNIVRNGLKILLESTEEFKIVGEATNGLEALELLKSNQKVDLLLMDINMPLLDGLSLLKETKENYPGIYTVMLTMINDETYIYQAFISGADGYILKNVSSEELIFALKQVSSGRKYLCSELVANLLNQWMFSISNTQIEKEKILDLTSREIEILSLIAQGQTNQEMAETLFLSKRTVEGHRQSLLEKTSSKNTASLIRFAVLNGIIQ